MNFDAKKYWLDRSKKCPYIEEDVKICYTGEGAACKGCKWCKKEKAEKTDGTVSD